MELSVSVNRALLTRICTVRREGSLLGVAVLDVVTYGGWMRTRHVTQRTLIVVH